MAGPKNEVDVDVGLDVHSQQITAAFNQIDARIKNIQKEMAEVSKTSLAAAKNFKTEVMGAMRDFNKASSTLTQFEKNINGPQRTQLAQWDKEEAAANRLASPEVRRPAGLHHHRGRSLLGEKARELASRQPMPLAHLPGPLGYRDLEHGLGKIHCDRRRIHFGLLLSGAFRSARRLWHVDAAQVAGGVHLITEADGRGFSQS